MQKEGARAPRLVFEAHRDLTVASPDDGASSAPKDRRERAETKRARGDPGRLRTCDTQLRRLQ